VRIESASAALTQCTTYSKPVRLGTIRPSSVLQSQPPGMAAWHPPVKDPTTLWNTSDNGPPEDTATAAPAAWRGRKIPTCIQGPGGCGWPRRHGMSLLRFVCCLIDLPLRLPASHCQRHELRAAQPPRASCVASKPLSPRACHPLTQAALHRTTTGSAVLLVSSGYCFASSGGI
jgi:hypothetical protein